MISGYAIGVCTMFDGGYDVERALCVIPAEIPDSEEIANAWVTAITKRALVNREDKQLIKFIGRYINVDNVIGIKYAYLEKVQVLFEKPKLPLIEEEEAKPF